MVGAHRGVYGEPKFLFPVHRFFRVESMHVATSQTDIRRPRIFAFKPHQRVGEVGSSYRTGIQSAIGWSFSQELQERPQAVV